MELSRNKEALEKIDELMTTMGFNQVGDGIYWHMYFGSDVKFDLSACSNETHAVMAHIFKVAIEYGKADKVDDIKKVLGLNNIG